MTFELFFFLLTAAAIALTSFVLFTSLARGKPSAAEERLGAGDFRGVLELLGEADLDARDLRCRGVAAKHLARFEQAHRDLERLLEIDPSDGETLLELALVAGYRGRLDEASQRLKEASRQRADLAESLQLHRAWIELASGERNRALRLFNEIEAPLENKLRQDLGAGEPMFLEWFLHAAALWQSKGDQEKADWAGREARKTAPTSELPSLFQDALNSKNRSVLQQPSDADEHPIDDTEEI